MLKESKAHNKIAGFVFEIISICSTAILLMTFIFTFFFRTVVVDGDSMNPTLWNGDRLIITAGVTEPEIGDIVVIAPESNELGKTLIKRLIATEGQTVDIDFKTGDVLVDGTLLDEPYIADLTKRDEGISFPLTVPEGCVFVMGDNRLRSTDSRDSRVGCLDEDYVMGRVILRLAPEFDAHVAEY